VREQALSQYRVLNTPEKAAAWLLKNKEELASWAIPSDSLDWARKNKPEMITFGYEPGVGDPYSANLRSLKEALPLLKQSPEVKEFKKGASGPWADQLLKANAYKVSLELSNAFNKLDPEKFTAGRNEITRIFAALGLDAQATEKLLKERGHETLLKRPELDWGPGARAKLEKGGSPNWGIMHALALKGLGSGEGKLMALNPSGLTKPSTQFGQFKELMKAAEVPSSQAAPFMSNERWYKYSGEKSKDKVLELIKAAEPKLVYFGGKESDGFKPKIAETAKQSGRIRLESTTKDGKSISKPFEYFIIQQPDGRRTTVMFGPHGGAMGFGSNRNIMEAVGEFAQHMNKNESLPESLKNVKVIETNQVR